MSTAYVNMRPLQDAVSHVDKLLLDPVDGYYNMLDQRHLLRQIGNLDVGYMLQELGLPEDAMEEAWYWGARIKFSAGADEEMLPAPPSGCPTYDDAMKINAEGKLVVNEESPLVCDLRGRSKRKWAKLDTILEYVRLTEEEYRNSKPPATGFETAVWTTCPSRECNRAGKCTRGQLFQKHAWCLPREKGDRQPVERLKLLHMLMRERWDAERVR